MNRTKTYNLVSSEITDFHNSNVIPAKAGIQRNFKWMPAFAGMTTCLFTRDVSHSNKGSILIEALLAVLIMSVSLTVIMQSLTTSYKVARINYDYMQAIFLAENQLAQLMPQQKKDSSFWGIEHSSNSDDYFQAALTKAAAKVAEDQSMDEVNLKVSWTTSHQKNELPITTLLLTPTDEPN